MKKAPIIFPLLLLFCMSFSMALAVESSPQDGSQSGKDIKIRLENLVAGHPAEASMKSLGKTLGGRDIWLLQLARGPAAGKPALLIVGHTQARRLLGAELALGFAERLHGDRDLQKWLDHFTFYIIPDPTPDATWKLSGKPASEDEGNNRPMDDDRDGRLDEDPAEDLNGDGLLTWTRVEDSTGEWMTYPADPRLMIKANKGKNEKGAYRLIFSEGTDNDQDGQFNEDGPGGVELDRNFTFKYPFFDKGAGPHQVSEVESRALADFAFDHNNIFAVVNLGGEDNLMTAWKVDDSANQGPHKSAVATNDSSIYEYASTLYQGFVDRKDAPEKENLRGSFSSWSYFHYGRWAFSTPGWWVPATEEAKKEDDKKEDKAKPDEVGEELKKDQAKRAQPRLNELHWLDAQGLQAHVPWSRVEHPDFPGQVVEVGGFKPLAFVTPSANLIAPLVEQHAKFIDKICSLAPRLVLRKAKVEALGKGLHRLTVEVVNEGYLPTMPEMGRINEIPFPLWLSFKFDQPVEYITGHAKMELPPLAGKGGLVEKSVLVRTLSSQVQVSVWSPSCGKAGKTVVLKQ